ncbi:MAG: translation initiation factor Sui1 [Desulfuromusa sp.]|nr:translation initiation factor Sui1 [Desulfuromusa sp.]
MCGATKSILIVSIITERRNKVKKKLHPTVYSTEHGRICPSCSKPLAGCICSKKHHVNEGDGVVRIGRVTKGRKGKSVTTISGLLLDSQGLLALGKVLKKRCGSGGTVKEGILEIQGDHRDMLFEELQKRGWRVKRCGG